MARRTRLVKRDGRLTKSLIITLRLPARSRSESPPPRVQEYKVPPKKDSNSSVMADSDSWPIFDIEDAAVSVPGLESVADILEIVAKKRLSTVVVRGMIDQRHRLKGSMKAEIHTDLLDPIELRKITFYSIGVDPVALWIGHESAWYSIFPDAAQSELWQSQCHAIGIFFAAVGYYEEDSARLTLPMIDQVTQILAKHASQINGLGCTLGDLIRACRSNTQFLEFHMRDTAPSQECKDGTEFDFPSTMFYKWIKGGCAMEELMTGTVNFNDVQDATLYTDVLDPVDAEGDTMMVDAGEDEEATPGPRTSIPKGKKKVWPPFKGEYISPQRPKGTPMPETFNDATLAMIYHFVHTGRENLTLDTITVGSINTALYKDFTFKMPQVASHMMTHNAREIYNALPPNFKKANIGKELLAQTPIAGPIKCTKDHDTKRSNDQMKGLNNGTETLKQRGSGRHSGATASSSAGAPAPAAVRAGRASRAADEPSAAVAPSVGLAPSPSGSGTTIGNVVIKDQPGFINGKPIPKPIKRSGVTWFGTGEDYY
ncbi:uncharacterized protein PAC_15069 [Phialocephala subalpina]|uniref:Uncharacterized protein n=1 Tax=Phialocephala subalpina TaxID=576137 RepID=A0A1L7XJF6_9HELO|nr:uncharacterized protein PAC_15069 [Phialocephala subalpina]